MDKVLLFGGSFDPIHHGHLIVSRQAAEQLGIPRVVLIPGASPPHKQGVDLAPAGDRLAMCQLATASDPLFDVSDCEILRAGPNYTLDTVTYFRQSLGPATNLFWLIGMDSLLELSTWHRAPELVEACTVVTAARPGFTRPETTMLERGFTPEQAERLTRHIVEGPRIDIAGTAIRRRVRAGTSIRYLVPEAVRRYIDERGLYGPDGARATRD